MTEEEKKAAEDKKASEETKKAEEEAAALAEKEKLAEAEKTDKQTIPISRFNEINERMKRAEAKTKKMEEDQAEAEKKALEEKGEYKVLAEKLKAEKEALEEKNTFAYKRMAVLAKLSMPDIQARDTEVIMKLIDFKTLKVDEEGNVTEGLDEQINKLKEGKPYLFSTEKLTDTDEKLGGHGKPGDIDWALLAKTLPREDFRKQYFKAFGMYPPPVG